MTTRRINPVDPITNPCSGRYEGGDGVDVVLKVDIDRINEYSKSLRFVSGTITENGELSPWLVEASSLYFKVIPTTVKISNSETLHELKASAKLFYSDGTRHSGQISVKVRQIESENWEADLVIRAADEHTMSFKHLERKSKFFENVGLDIDYTEKVTWPVVDLKNVSASPVDMLDRKIDAFQAFEDAGIELVYDKSQSEKLEDPTPQNPWTRSDLYDAMMAYYDEVGKHENIWCMMGTTPPDKRYMGFSFDKDGHHGFGLFTEHRSFDGLESSDPKKKAEASRRFLHYLVHECGHCLGLKHPFEIGAPDSLSWMNYAWKYDVGRDAGSFYRNFRFTFSDQELTVLRHSPEKAFRSICEASYLKEIMGSGYVARSEAPDEGDDDESKHDLESTNQMPTRKVGLDLKVRNDYLKGQLLSFEARLTNQGKLPALIEKDLSLESGNLQLYVTKPDGHTELIESFVRPVHSGYHKPYVLYTPADEEGQDDYSELVIVGRGSHGYQINQPGKYGIRAVYNGGRYSASSASYTLDVLDNDDDAGTADEILTATTLRTANYSRWKDAFAYWNRLEGETMQQKRAKIATLIALLEGLTQESGREAVAIADGEPKRRTTAFMESKASIDKLQILKDTKEVVQYFHDEGTAADNLEYANVVLARGKVFVSISQTEEGDKEFNQLLNDLMARGEKYDVVAKLTKRWNKVKNPPSRADKQTSESLQKRVGQVLSWNPTTRGNGESELSGIGLGKPFSNFNSEHVKKASKIIQMLFTKFDETQDLNATLSYADKLQKGREVNNKALQWAVEAFIVHCDDAKKAGIRYPEPQMRDKSFETDAAMVATIRRGQPSEDWMNYWRCDADFNYHHRHWHVVYTLAGVLEDNHGQIGSKVHLERQGELFGYMHSQMLARYDAERESWGLPPVMPWRYRDTAPSFNAGLEFHNDSEWDDFVPRPVQRWPYQEVSMFSRYEYEYNNAIASGYVARGVEMSPNWSGHVLEPSSEIYSDRFGSFHNDGHNLFATLGIENDDYYHSYMDSAKTAVRDPIFFRWHKKVDDMWQANNEYYREELNYKPPPVTITADDIVLSTDRNPPSRFTDWRDGNWTGRAPSEETVLKTFLGPPKKMFEWDNKLSHEKFYYHLRMKRNPGTRIDQDIPVTIRIFICPRRRQSERRRWIEMDKFVCNIASGSEHVEVTRADVHSSVIKRLHKDLEGDEPDAERRLVRTLGGFCECGWPYDMLLPRGTAEGEDYVVCVIATDNKIDSIGIRTTCGSMSYCGASKQRYPDSRNMGYPFCNPITFDHQKINVPEVFDYASNAAYKSFKIKNDFAEAPRIRALDMWWPYVQLGINDGTREGDYETMTDYIRSGLVGSFRVLIDDNAAAPGRARRILVRFQGRGAGGGAYVIRDVHLAQRRGNTLDIVNGSSVRVVSEGRTSFAVPESGLISDAFEYRFDPARGDYFVTFTLENAGVYLPPNRGRQTSTYHIPPGVDASDVSGDWTRFSRIYKRYSSIQCVSGIMAEM